MNEDPFGASTGQIGDLASQGLVNDFTTVPNNDVTSSLGTDRVQPRSIASGTMRGTLRIENNDGSYTIIGEIPGQVDSDGNAQVGQALFDPSGNLQAMYLGETDYKYNITTGKNYYQSGKLPDGSYGIVIANSGYNVSELFS